MDNIIKPSILQDHTGNSVIEIVQQPRVSKSRLPVTKRFSLINLAAICYKLRHGQRYIKKTGSARGETQRRKIHNVQHVVQVPEGPGGRHTRPD